MGKCLDLLLGKGLIFKLTCMHLADQLEMAYKWGAVMSLRNQDLEPCSQSHRGVYNQSKSTTQVVAEYCVSVFHWLGIAVSLALTLMMHATSYFLVLFSIQV